MPSQSYIQCSIEVVKFYRWAEAKISHGNLTVEGWNGGQGYFCEYFNVTKSFKEYNDYHDMEPIPGPVIDAKQVFKNVRNRNKKTMMLEQVLYLIYCPLGFDHWFDSNGNSAAYFCGSYIQEEILHLILVDETKEKI